MPMLEFGMIDITPVTGSSEDYPSLSELSTTTSHFTWSSTLTLIVLSTEPRAKEYTNNKLLTTVMSSREASHAGSWYSDDGPTLSRQLDRYLDQVPNEIEGLGQLPVPGARIIIGPYATILTSSRSSYPAANQTSLAMRGTPTQVPVPPLPTSP